jgi:hypothetical protein
MRIDREISRIGIPSVARSEDGTDNIYMMGHYMIAFCDILGFSDLVQNNPLDRVVEEVLGWVRKALEYSLYKTDLPSEVPLKAAFEKHEHLGVSWFSDTILLYSKHDQDEAIRQLIEVVGWLLFATNRFGRARIRAGISYGEAFIDGENSIFAGKPIVEACVLEKIQQWSGAALTETAVQRIPQLCRSGKCDDWRVVPYKVPLKGGSYLETLAVNWTIGLHHGWKMAWSPLSELPTQADGQNQPEIYAKFMNTKRFHDSECRFCRREGIEEHS